jgi:glutathione reductase (NADPH)
VVTTLDGKAHEVEKVIYATGRKPNTHGLGLDALGVLLDKDGGIIVDNYSKTNLDWLYAVGDVTNRLQLTPVAIREGHAFADTIFGNRPTAVDIGPVPTAVFSTPEIGTVGMTEEDARKSHDVVLFRTNFRAMKATLSGSSERVMMKILVDKPTDKVLGVHIMGEGTGEMIQLLGIALRMGATKRDFDMTLAVHPTAAEELVTLRTPVA